MEHKELWNKVEKRCLELAEQVLEKETAPTEREIEAVKNYIGIAKEIEAINLHWAVQNRCGAAAFRGQPSSQQGVKN